MIYDDRTTSTQDLAIKNSSKEAIDLLEGRCEDISEWGLLFAAYTNYAYELDEENRSEEAVDYYEKGGLIFFSYNRFY